MENAGYIYALMNPSMEGFVKVGRTTRSPEERAKELSASTSVPTPFVVVYDAFFDNCEHAERYVHTLLEERGYRLSTNREFFRAPIKDVIKAILLAEQELGGVLETELPADRGDEDGTAFSSQGIAPWETILEEADRHFYGEGNTLENYPLALKLYQQAARLGAPEAFLQLAIMCAEGAGCRQSQEEGIEWLKKGTQLGGIQCWEELASIYMGESPYFEGYFNLENARKCLRNLLGEVRFQGLGDDGERKVFASLKSYIGLCKKSRFYPDDTELIDKTISRFLEYLSSLPENNSQRAKIAQLHQLRTA